MATSTTTRTTSTGDYYMTPRTMMKSWAVESALMVGAMFLFWAVSGAVRAAFFGATADQLRENLLWVGIFTPIGLAFNLTYNWCRVRASWGQVTIQEAGSDRVMRVEPHRIAAALAPWYADAARPDVIAFRLARLQESCMAGSPDMHIAAVLGVMVNPTTHTADRP